MLKEENYPHLENIAELLWLSKFTGMQSLVREEVKDEKSQEPNQKPEIEDDEVEDDEPNIEPEQEEEQEDDLEVHTDNQEDNISSSKQKSAKAIQSPKKLALDHYREWEKAFKFINLKRPSKNRYELDEEKTVENIASTKVFDLVFKRVEEKSFFLTLVIDQGETMELWSELIKNFEQMLMTMGVFSRITIYYWDTKKEKPILYVDKSLKREVSEKLVVIDGQRNLVWVMSDCIASSWKSGEAFKSIDRWATKSFTSILQMFPKEMWMGTMLFKGKHIRLSSNSFNPINKKLQVKSSKREKNALKIPVISFDPYALQAWAKVVVNSKDNSISGIELENLDFEALKIPLKKEITSEMRMQRFYSQASPTAQKLAFHMSVLPVDFQVTRILQEERLPKSKQSHVAEVFLGGLIERTTKNKSVSYKFYPNIREELNANISADESFEIMADMSNFVSSHLGIGFDFKALLADPNGAFEGDFVLSEESLAYAKLASRVLKRKGGALYTIAKRIDSKIEEVKIEKREQSKLSLDDIVTIKIGQNFSKTKYLNNKSGIPVIRIKNLQQNIEDMQLLENDEFYRINDDIDEKFHYRIDKESLLINSVKEYENNYELKPTLFKPMKNISSIYINNPIYALFTDNKYLLLEYFYFILYSEEILSNISNYLTGTDIPILNKNNLQKLLKTIPLISLDEQRRYIKIQKQMSLEKNVLKQLFLSNWKEQNIAKEYLLESNAEVDILLHHDGVDLAIIEIKSFKDKNIKLGLQQAIKYGEKLKVEYVYVTNGEVIYEYSLSDEIGKYIKNYPTINELSSRYTQSVKLSNKEKIIAIFNKNIKGKKTDIYNNYDGKKGYWLEKQFGIESNSSNSPDIYGYEMKNETSSGKITFGDWSADEYIFQHGRPIKVHLTNQNYNISKNRFLEIFGKPNENKKGRLSWSSPVSPSYLNQFTSYGQVLKIDTNSDIVIYYSYGQDKREDKKELIPLSMQKEDVVLAKWYRDTIKQKLKDKFNQQGWFTCKMNKNGIYESIHFGKPMNFKSWIEILKKGEVFFDSGMYYGNSRNYSQWRASTAYWNSLITEDNTLNCNEIKNYIVKVEYEGTLGSGFIVKLDEFSNKFFIFTAKHIFINKFTNEEVNMKLEEVLINYDNKTFFPKSFIALESDMIVFIFDNNISNTIDNLKSIPISSHPSQFKESAFAGYSMDNLICEKYTYSHALKQENIYQIKNSHNHKMNDVIGLSGSGLFIKEKDEYLVEGIIIQYEESISAFNYIAIRPYISEIINKIKKSEKALFNPLSWNAIIKEEEKKSYFNELQNFLENEINLGTTILPKKEFWYNALNLTPLDKVKVVILGQDPYPTVGHAHGLAFSVLDEIKPLPKSLQNIYQELFDDLGIDNNPIGGNLQKWAEQGVLLLNSVLTVEEGKSNSHQGRGWEQFTDRIIEVINNEQNNIVFILWGTYAQKKGAFIDTSRHLVLKSPHPSPLSAYRGFFGSKPFSRINKYLKSNNIEPIDWNMLKHHNSLECISCDINILDDNRINISRVQISINQNRELEFLYGCKECLEDEEIGWLEIHEALDKERFMSWNRYIEKKLLEYKPSSTFFKNKNEFDSKIKIKHSIRIMEEWFYQNYEVLSADTTKKSRKVKEALFEKFDEEYTENIIREAIDKIESKYGMVQWYSIFNNDNEIQYRVNNENIKFDFFKAGTGNSILVSTYNTNILIDGGLRYTYREIKQKLYYLLESNSVLNLVISTHIHDDHIGGLIELFKDKNARKIVKKVWFNFFNDIIEFDSNNSKNISASQMKMLFHLLNKYDISYNDDIFLDKEKMNKEYIVNDIKLELLSPRKRDYEHNIIRRTSNQNLLSIAFILKYQNKNFLFLADASVKVINYSLKRLGYSKENRLEVDFVKLSHGGSKRDINSEFLDMVSTNRYVILTDGKRFDFPHKETLELILTHELRKESIELICNYRDVLENKLSEEEVMMYNCKLVYDTSMEF